MFEMFWYLKPSEAPKTDVILSRLSESGICLLTGETTNLLSIPVDMNTNNMLPTNMVCLSKSIVEDLQYIFRYDVACYEGVTITFNTAECLVEYNKKLIEALLQDIPTPKQHNFVSIYEFLMSKHLKGIDKITYAKDNSSMDWTQLQRYWFMQIDKIKNNTSKIISPLGIN